MRTYTVTTLTIHASLIEISEFLRGNTSTSRANALVSALSVPNTYLHMTETIIRIYSIYRDTYKDAFVTLDNSSQT